MSIILIPTEVWRFSSSFSLIFPSCFCCWTKKSKHIVGIKSWYIMSVSKALKWLLPNPYMQLQFLCNHWRLRLWWLTGEWLIFTLGLSKKTGAGGGVMACLHVCGCLFPVSWLNWIYFSWKILSYCGHDEMQTWTTDMWQQNQTNSLTKKPVFLWTRVNWILYISPDIHISMPNVSAYDISSITLASLCFVLFWIYAMEKKSNLQCHLKIISQWKQQK